MLIKPMMNPLYRVILVVVFTCCTGLLLQAQDITWANKLLEITEKYQFDNNRAEAVLGLPTVYPGRYEELKLDPYSEGYVLFPLETNRKNIIKVGFPKPVLAKQVVIGGIFNIGTIYSISIFTQEGKEKEIYRPDLRASKTKFNTFSAFFAQANVVAVRIVFDHTKISEWNLVKGIGLSNSDQAIELKPNILIPQDGFGKKEKVGENIISTDCYEFSPKVSPDGKTLYFVKECPNQPDQDIWYSELGVDGRWTEAKNIGAPLNNKGHNFVASISLDGRFLVLGNTYKTDGTEDSDGVSISYRKEDGTWDVPKAIKIPGYKNTNQNANFYMSADESVLLMAIQDERSQGDLDIYAATYNRFTQQWSASVNLGTTINTPFAEDYPFLAPDGKTLYFSSKGYLGYGGHDIYMSKRMDDTWTNWTKPVNLGPLVNSKTDDKGFTIAARGDQAYFNSVNFEIDSAHHMDIYKIDLPKILKQNPQILISGKVTDGTKNTGIRATIRAKNSAGELMAFCTSNPKNGKYVMSVPFGQVYDLRVDAINFFKNEEKLSLTDTMKGVELFKDFKMYPHLDSGQYITLNNILFEKNSAKLTANSMAVLDTLADRLLQQPDAKIEIGGHTDNLGELPAAQPSKTGNSKTKVKQPKPVLVDNKKLSLERAKSVGAYLIQKGVKESRISYMGYGASVPVADNKTEDGRAKNRRVVVTYLSKIPQD